MVAFFGDKRGVSAIGAILAILIFGLLVAVIVSVVTIGASVGLQEELGIKAFYIAEGGLHYAIENGTLCNFNVPSPKDLGGGTFIVNSSCMGTWGGCTAPTALTNPAGPADTWFVVGDTTGYVIPGTITVESEYAFCNGTSGGPPPNTFTECARGVKGTTAAAHGAAVQVTQCTVTSTGTYSSGVFFGDVNRTVRANVGQ
jgi:hypothetical protein